MEINNYNFISLKKVLVMKYVFYCVLSLLSLMICSSCSDKDPIDSPTSNNEDEDEDENGNKIEQTDAVSIDIKKYFIPIGEETDTRQLMSCEEFSDELIEAFNDSLDIAIKKAPSKRDKVVTAATFMVSFCRSIPYAYEGGGDMYKLVCRYNRKGLFLKTIEENGYTYPAWGCDVEAWPGLASTGINNIGQRFKNGLHCSSFVAWCLFNASVANASLLDKTLADDFRIFPLSNEIVLKDAVDLIQPGDLLWFSGHIAIVIKVDGDTVTFAECAIWNNDHLDSRNGARWRTFSKRNTDYDTFRFKSLIQMAGVYGD